MQAQHTNLMHLNSQAIEDMHMWYQHFGTGELQSVEVFTQQGGISKDQFTGVSSAISQSLDRSVIWPSILTS